MSKTLREIDAEHHIHPFTNNTDMHRTGAHIIVSGQGSYVTDDHGVRLLDGLAGLWCVNVGYGRREIVDAVKEQMEKLCFYPSFFASTTEPTILLAEKLHSLGLPRLTHTVFSNSGSEANETAIKILLNYWNLKGQPRRTKFMSRTHAYHGVTLGATSLTGLLSCTKPFGLPAAGFIRIPGPYHYITNSELSPENYAEKCLAETETIIRCEGPDTIAALFAEPIQGAGGVIIPPPGYLTKLRALARKYGILYVSDEVITAFGRIGAYYASDLWDLDPDIVILAKGITSGYIPLGATRVSSEIAETLNAGGYFATGNTYSGHPVACAAALANIELIEKENLVGYVANDIGPYFERKFLEFQSHPAVGQARCCKMMGAMELLNNGEKVTDPMVGLGPKAATCIRKHGAIVRGIANLIAVSPCLNITHAEVDELFASIKAGLDEFAGNQ